jgi:hypothetical protein
MKKAIADRRISSRINQTQTIRIRTAGLKSPEEIRPTLNVSWDGLYFATSLGHYCVDTIVFIIRDFRVNKPANREEKGTVVRVDKLKEGRWGVAIRLDMPSMK